MLCFTREEKGRVHKQPTERSPPRHWFWQCLWFCYYNLQQNPLKTNYYYFLNEMKLYKSIISLYFAVCSFLVNWNIRLVAAFYMPRVRSDNLASTCGSHLQPTNHLPQLCPSLFACLLLLLGHPRRFIAVVLFSSSKRLRYFQILRFSLVHTHFFYYSFSLQDIFAFLLNSHTRQTRHDILLCRFVLISNARFRLIKQFFSPLYL